MIKVNSTVKIKMENFNISEYGEEFYSIIKNLENKEMKVKTVKKFGHYPILLDEESVNSLHFSEDDLILIEG